MTPPLMMDALRLVAKRWDFDVVSIGYPGVVRQGGIACEPYNLGSGWIGFNFQEAFGRPVKIINDAAMQALGGYTGGKMLFLGLGTGLGSAMIIDDLVVELELGHLPYSGGNTFEDYVGEEGRIRFGNKKWRGTVTDVIEVFRKALLPDYIVLGGGNASRLKELPSETLLGNNNNALLGGFRLWSESSRPCSGNLLSNGL